MFTLMYAEKVVEPLFDFGEPYLKRKLDYLPSFVFNWLCFIGLIVMAAIGFIPIIIDLILTPVFLLIVGLHILVYCLSKGDIVLFKFLEK